MISSCGRSNVDGGYQFPCHDRHEKNGEANFNPCHLQLLSSSINQREKGSVCSCIHNGNPMLQVPSSWHMPVDMHSKPNGNYLSVKSVLQCCRCKSHLCANRGFATWKSDHSRITRAYWFCLIWMSYTFYYKL